MLPARGWIGFAGQNRNVIGGTIILARMHDYLHVAVAVHRYVPRKIQ